MYIGLGPNLTPNHLVNFVNADGNILVAQTSTVPSSTSIVGFLSELDISLPVERTGTVIDHFNYDTHSATESHDVLVLEAPTNVRPGLKSYFEIDGGVLAFPHAVGHVLGSGPLLTPVVRAPATAYSYNPKEQAEVLDADDLFAAGQQLSLLSVFQARNSARVTVLGSAEMLQNKWFEAVVGKPGGMSFRTDNQNFAQRVSGWTFQETGVVRVNSIEHKLQGSDELNPSIYRIKNDVVSLHMNESILYGTLSLTLFLSFNFSSLTTSPCPSGAGINGFPLLFLRVTFSSSNSPCFRPSIA